MEKRENDLVQFFPINIHATPQRSAGTVQPRGAHSPSIPPCRADVQPLLATTIRAISNSRHWEVANMKRRTKARRSNRQKTKLRLPDLEHAKSAVLVSLRSPESQRSYRHSIDDFVCWYCSEPRLSFNKTVVTRYRIHLEDRLLAPGTINVRLAAVRRLAYEAADTGLLSPDLAAGIRRLKGAKKLGLRLGNWVTGDEARSLWQLPNAYREG